MQMVMLYDPQTITTENMYIFQLAALKEFTPQRLLVFSEPKHPNWKVTLQS